MGGDTSILRLERDGTQISIWIADFDRGTVAGLQWTDPRDALDHARMLVDVAHHAIAEQQLDSAVNVNDDDEPDEEDQQEIA